MALLRLANDETKRVNLDDSGESWIELRSDISKRAFIDLVKSMPEGVSADTPLTIDQGVGFQTHLFELFIVNWSLKDAKGADLPATVDNYLGLSREAGDAVDAAIAKHFESLTPSKDDVTKSA